VFYFFPFLVLSLHIPNCILYVTTFLFCPALFLFPCFYQPHYLKLSHVVPKFFFFFCFKPSTFQYNTLTFAVFVIFLLVPSPSYLLSYVPLCVSFPDPTFFVHLPFSLSLFHFRCLRLLHPIFLPILKNL
jgi:hypothetical protein